MEMLYGICDIVPPREMKQLADNLWIKRYPLSVLGTDHGRTVTILRLRSGKLIVSLDGAILGGGFGGDSFLGRADVAGRSDDAA
jgi:hypothetical protein